MKNPLLDKDFLRELDQYNHKEVYAKIISLSFSELPIEQIEGKITGGSLNIDGSSILRRTCNLTLVAKELNINDFYWGLTNKFKLEIGVKNFINPEYPDIIWFNKGIFCITSFNTSYSTNSYQISISGQDKMCMLNGTLGGSLYASIDFGQMESYKTSFEEANITDENYLTAYEANKYYYENKNYTPLNGEEQYILSNEEYQKGVKYYTKNTLMQLDKLTLRHIIRESVHTYANEPYHNIIINDVDDYGLELLEYRGDKPLYFLFNAGICENMTYNGDMKVISPTGEEKTLSSLEVGKNEIDSLVNGFNSSVIEFTFPGSKDPNKKYNIAKVEYGQTAGYRQTDLTYYGELISGVGETLTSILDKIVNMIGEFEYFYDIDGKFIFQKKKTYVNTTWNTLVETDDKDLYAENASYTSAISYSFEDNNLVTSFSNNPQLNNLKNDFSVWGVKKGMKDQDLAIHARIAIDKKPFFYKTFDGKYYVTEEYYIEENIKDFVNIKDLMIVDWREIIYQMALDYFAHNQEDDFLNKINENNFIFGEYLYKNGYTGYEQYYTDLQGFWRDLYNIEPTVERETIGGKYEEVQVPNEAEEGTYTLEQQWIKFEEKMDDFTCNYYLPTTYGTKDYYKCSKDNEYKHFNDSFAFWHKNVILAPETLFFWFDFLDEVGELEQFSVPYIGSRAKSINDSSVSAIYFRETPNIIFTSSKTYDPDNINTGYVYIWLQDYIENTFVISAQGKSAKDRIDELLYNHTYCTESVTLQSIPVYYLEPNTRIYIHDEESKINGDYIVSKISIPLTYNGLMSINATKAVERLL